MSELRKRHVQSNELPSTEDFLEKLSKVDAFAKLKNEVRDEQTNSGATISIITTIIIVVLLLSELRIFFSKTLHYSYDVDAELDSRIAFNVDLTVKTPCSMIGADIVDKTTQGALESLGIFAEEETWWNLPEKYVRIREKRRGETVEFMKNYHKNHHQQFKRRHINHERRIETLLKNVTKEVNSPHVRIIEMSAKSIGGRAISIFNMASLLFGDMNDMPKKKEVDKRIIEKFSFPLLSEEEKMKFVLKHPPDSCRIYGTAIIPRVEGKFHIMSGKSMNFLGNHAHVSFRSANANLPPLNWSHRIDHLSFTQVNLLDDQPFSLMDGIEQQTPNENVLHHYVVQIVPLNTNYDSYYGIHSMNFKEFQYSYQYIQKSTSNQSSFSSGIELKYSLTPLLVKVDVMNGIPVIRLLIRLCGTLGGVVATSKIIAAIARKFF
ncbi:hypothetical protein SNEBB_000177 [Seison nebaliae]|nr:hypothetical protein SNEBB_000177 [Seison nebaliae]